MAHQDTTNGSLLLMDGNQRMEQQSEQEYEVHSEGGASSSPSDDDTPQQPPPPPPPRKQRIIVPDRSIQGGLDWKFDSNPRDVKLHDILTPEEYTDTITRINDTLRTARATSLDGALLATGPLMVPLAVWGVRHKRQVKRRKRLLKEAMEEFNAMHPHLEMRWDQSMPESRLTIERRAAAVSQESKATRTGNEVLTILSDEQNAFV